MSDLKTLLAAEESNRTDYHWMIAFTVRVHETVLKGLTPEVCPGCGEEHETADEMAVITDTITVGCGDDAQVAVDRARAHITDEAQYGVKTQPGSFRLKGVKLLSIKEL